MFIRPTNRDVNWSVGYKLLELKRHETGFLIIDGIEALGIDESKDIIVDREEKKSYYWALRHFNNLRWRRWNKYNEGQWKAGDLWSSNKIRVCRLKPNKGLKKQG